MTINDLILPHDHRPTLRVLVALWVCLLVAVTGPVARATEAPAQSPAKARESKKSFDIPAGEAFSTLKRFFAQSGEQLIYKADALEGVRTNAVKGRFTSREALDRMLSRTRLSVAQDEKTGVMAITLIADASGRGDSSDAQPDVHSTAKKKTAEP